MKYVFIVNPTSGNNKGLYAGKIIEEYCKSLGIKHEVIYTKKKNDAKVLAILYGDCNNTTVFSVGGDGTLNEVVNGFAGSKNKLGLIPIGTGNDFYKSLKDFDGDKIDLCKVNNNYFINVASIGLDAEIADYANILKEKNLSGKMVYNLSIIKNFFNYKPIDINLDSNDKKITILAICNGKYYGGGYNIAPNAKLNNGLFDVVEVNSINKLEIIKLLVKLTKSNHLQDSNVNFYNTTNLSIESKVPIICNLDGEIIKGTNFNFSIEKEAINLEKIDSLRINNILKEKKLIK